MSISQPYYPLPFFLFSPFSLVFPREPLEGIGKVTHISFVVSTHALLLIFFSHCSNNPIEYSFEVNQFPLFQFEAQKEEEEEETRATPFFSLSLSLELSASSCLSFACLLHFPFHTCFNLYHSPPEGVVGSNTYCLRSPSFARCIYVTL